MSPAEPTVDHRTSMPKGYAFLKKGNSYRTGLCRRLTHASGRTLFVVTKNNSSIGIRAPRGLIDQVFEEDVATRQTRREAVEKRDACTQKNFREELDRLFPHIPEACADTVTNHTLKKRSGRVGRTGLLDLKIKARLAVAAHIRHKHTSYETLLDKDGVSRSAARDQVQADVDRTLRQWEGGGGTLPTRSRGQESAEVETRAPITESQKVPAGLSAQRHTKILGGKRKMEDKISARRTRSKHPEEDEGRVQKAAHERPISALSPRQSNARLLPQNMDRQPGNRNDPIMISSSDEQSDEEEWVAHVMVAP